MFVNHIIRQRKLRDFFHLLNEIKDELTGRRLCDCNSESSTMLKSQDSFMLSLSVHWCHYRHILTS